MVLTSTLEPREIVKVVVMARVISAARGALVTPAKYRCREEIGAAQELGDIALRWRVEVAHDQS